MIQNRSMLGIFVGGQNIDVDVGFGYLVNRSSHGTRSDLHQYLSGRLHKPKKQKTISFHRTKKLDISGARDCCIVCSNCIFQCAGREQKEKGRKWELENEWAGQGACNCNCDAPELKMCFYVMILVLKSSTNMIWISNLGNLSQFSGNFRFFSSITHPLMWIEILTKIKHTKLISRMNSEHSFFDLENFLLGSW